MKVYDSVKLVQDSLQHVTGCIGLLARWTQHPNIRLSVPATRALANLDMDDRPEIKFSSHLHLLHPTMRCTEMPKLDVVFIHGLLGGVFFTWRQRDSESTSLSILRKCVTFQLIRIYSCHSLIVCMLCVTSNVLTLSLQTPNTVCLPCKQLNIHGYYK